MAAIRKRPKVCTHPTCQGGECGKCAYNPRNDYGPFKAVNDSDDEGGVKLPGWLSLFVGVVAGLTAVRFGNLVIGFLFIVVAVLASLGAILWLSGYDGKPPENSGEFRAP